MIYVLLDRTGAEVARSTDYDRLLRRFNLGEGKAVEMARLDDGRPIVLRRRGKVALAQAEAAARAPRAAKAAPGPKATTPKAPRPPAPPREPRPQRDTCEGCGVSMAGISRPRFCSSTCGDAHRKRVHRASTERHRIPAGPAACEGCGTSLAGRRWGIRFCTARCGIRLRRGQQPLERRTHCKACGVALPPDGKVFCGTMCRSKQASSDFRAKQRALFAAVRAARSCLGCGAQGLPPGRRAYCSDRCQDARLHRLASDEAKARTSARLAGAEPRCGCGAALVKTSRLGPLPSVCLACRRKLNAQKARKEVAAVLDPRQPLRPAYARVLAMVGDGATVDEVYERAEGLSRLSVRSMLSRLAIRGDLVRLGPGAYAPAVAMRRAA